MDTASVRTKLVPHAIRRAFGRYDHRQPSSSGVVSEFIERSMPWSRARIPMPGRLRWALWALILVEFAWGIWLATIVSGGSPCQGSICMVATLRHHAAALLACGVFCIAGLLGLIPTTRGFSKCNGTEVIGLALTSAAGGASLLGVAAVMIGALIILIVVTTFVLALTATPRRETDDARPRTPFPLAPAKRAGASTTLGAERPD